MPSALPVAVIGGGIAGLAAALHLRRVLGPERIVLIERERRLGGKIVSERVAGFVIEGGPDCFLAVKPGGVELCRELGLEDRLCGTNPLRRGSFIKRNGQLYRLPEGLTGLVPSRVTPLLRTAMLSIPGRLRAGLELFVARRRDTGDESIRDFTTRRFGREAYDWLVEPLLGGIFAGDGSLLSLAATFPQLRELEQTHGSVLRAMRRRAPGARGTGSAFVTPATGLAEIVEAIEARLGNVTTGSPVVSLRGRAPEYRIALADGRSIPARAVVCATPAFVTSELIAPLDAELAGELAAIPFVSTATISLAYPAAALSRPLDGYGYLSPRAEGGPVVACTWTSTKFPSRAPGDAALVRLFVGRDGMEAVVFEDDERLVSIAREELHRTVGITAEPTFWRVFRWAKGMPQYVMGHLDRVGRIEHCLARHPGLFLAGASYCGVGIPDCIESGSAAAGRALAFLAERPE